MGLRDWEMPRRQLPQRNRPGIRERRDGAERRRGKGLGTGLQGPVFRHAGVDGTGLSLGSQSAEVLSESPASVDLRRGGGVGL